MYFDDDDEDEYVYHDDEMDELNAQIAEIDLNIAKMMAESRKTYKRNSQNWDLGWKEWEIFPNESYQDSSDSRAGLVKYLGQEVKAQGTISKVEYVEYDGLQQYRVLLKDVRILVNEKAAADELIIYYDHVNIFQEIDKYDFPRKINQKIYFEASIIKYTRSKDTVSEHGTTEISFGLDKLTNIEAGKRERNSFDCIIE